jgi:hypothetical protein
MLTRCIAEITGETIKDGQGVVSVSEVELAATGTNPPLGTGAAQVAPNYENDALLARLNNRSDD